VVAEEVRLSGIDPSHLGIELTETTMIDDFQAVTANIHALRETGIKIFVDDFGVGYSSLSSLSRLPVDVLKIDRSFISDMVDHPRGAALVAKIVEIGHIFDLPTIAEGIETEAELEAVRAVGCDYAQGYFLARPLPLEDARALIAASTIRH
jgi:EAL domain-containing protein (putative c-di-GMP-specific phosphodiesterase class I)